MDDQSPPKLATHYQSSRGPMEITAMAYPHIANAIGKMERDGHDQPHVLAALRAQLAILDAEKNALAAESAVDPAGELPAPRLGVIGDNGAPTPTSYELVKTELEDLRAEAKHWLDGAAISSQAEADKIGLLRDKIDAASARAEKQRVAEKKPHDDAANAVQEKYNLLIGSTKAVTGIAVTMRATINTALTVWLNKVKAEQDAVREKAVVVAREEAEKAEMHIAHTHDTTDLDDREAANRQADIARQAAFDLAAANRAKPQVHGEGRAIGLVSKWRAEVIDVRAALQFYKADRTEEYWEALTAVVAQFAKDDIACKKTGQEVPGIKFIEERVAR